MSSDNNIHQGHRKRMKSAMLEHGLDGLNEHQILELLLFYGISNGDTNPTAHRLIQHFGSLKGVLEADYSDLLKVKGIGENAASLIKFAQMFSGVYLRSTSFTDGVLNISDTAGLCKYFESIFLGVKDEQFRAMLFDDELNMVKEQLLAEGTVGTVVINKRKFADFVIKNNCSRVVIAHNHPNGASLPSKQDVASTVEFAEFLYNLEIDLLDHIIVGRIGSLSMRASGYI